MSVVSGFRLRACRDQRRRPDDGSGYYLQMAETRSDGRVCLSAVWSTVAHERNLAAAFEMALLIESDLLEHGSHTFRSLIVPASCLEPRIRRRLELELTQKTPAGYARTLRRLVELERAFAADVPAGARLG